MRKSKDGGFKPKNQYSKDRALAGEVYHHEGKGYARGGSVGHAPVGGAGSGMGRLRKSRMAAKVPAKTEL